MPAFPSLVRRADFEALGRTGIARSCRLLVVRARRTDGEVTRIGISTPRGLGGAVARNRMRRRLRDAVRRRYGSLPAGWDLLVSGRPAAAEASFGELTDALDGLLRRCGLAA